MTGKNTPSAALLRSYVERVERIDAEKKALSEDRTAVLNEANSNGFDKKAMLRAIKRRQAKPHDLQEADALDDLYQHALGMAPEPPLFRSLAGMIGDAAGGEKLIEAFKLLVPPGTEVIITVAGKKQRIWRVKDGEPMIEDYVEPDQEPKTHRRTTLPPATRKEVPDCSEDEAEKLGAAARRENVPVVDNPFPYDDARRPRWDKGWRNEGGDDGMGHDEE